jgi:hypothetical protein
MRSAGGTQRSNERIVQVIKSVSRSGSDRRKKRNELLPFPDRRGAFKPNGGHPVPMPVNESEDATIEQSSRAFRLPRFMKPRKAAAGKSSIKPLKRRGPKGV